MLKLSTNQKIHVIPMPTDSDYRVITFKNSINKELIIMTGISELEYKKIKSLNDFFIKRGNYRFYIEPDNVICFGEIDFSEGSEDCETLDCFNWLEHLGIKGVSIPANYNYAKNVCTSPNNKILWTETFKNSVLCRYYHGRLGKPQYTLIFRDIYKRV